MNGKSRVMLARCVVNEYPDAEAAKIGRDYQKQALQKGFFSNAKLSLIISTSPEANLVISLYASEADANSNLADRQTFFANLPVKIKDTFMYEGTCEIVKNDLKNYQKSTKEDMASHDTLNLEEKIDRLLGLVEDLKDRVT